MTLDELRIAAHEKRAVVGWAAWAPLKPLPAAFVLEWHGSVLARLLPSMCVHGEAPQPPTARWFNFVVEMVEELDAGIRGSTDRIAVVVASGDPGGEEGEFEEFMLDVLGSWYDAVVTADEYRKQVEDEEAILGLGDVG